MKDEELVALAEAQWIRSCVRLPMGRGNIPGAPRYGAGAPACLRRQACSCPSHSDVLSHAWCQACVELCLLGREGPMLG